MVKITVLEKKKSQCWAGVCKEGGGLGTSEVEEGVELK